MRNSIYKSTGFIAQIWRHKALIVAMLGVLGESPTVWAVSGGSGLGSVTEVCAQDGSNNVACGSFSSASGGFSTANGSSSTANGSYSTATGGGSTANGSLSTASGFESSASGNGDIASGAFSSTVIARGGVQTNGNSL